MASSRARVGTREGWIAEIESLRGVAICLVVLFHTNGLVSGRPSALPHDVSWPAAFIVGGHTGVTLFFVLSGFLLAPPFLAEAMGGHIVARRDYFARRARRILPLYWLFVAVASVATASMVGQVFRGLPYLFFLNSIPNVVEPLWPWSAVWWSLATEAQFYLLLPLLGLLGRREWRPLLAVLLTMYVVAYAGAVSGWIDHWPPGARISLFASLFGRGPAFACGAFSAMLAPSVRAATADTRSRWSWMAADLVFIVTVAILGFVLHDIVSMGYVEAELGRNWWHLIEALLWSVMVLTVVASPARMPRILSSGVMGALGRWSYSLYLIHFPVLWFTFWVPGPHEHRISPREGVIAILVLIGCVVASAASYRLVERPFLARRAMRRGVVEPEERP